ncbi:MAG: Crp/Fnr family transcriptional regulator [Bacteroidota bacterium]
MELSDLFKKYLGINVSSNPDLLDQLAVIGDEVHIPRGKKVVIEGEYSPYAYLILKGAARSYYTKGSNGIVNWFALEGEVAISMDNYMGEKSRETILFMEESHCLRLDLEKWRELEKNEVLVARLSIKLLEEYISFVDKHARNLANREGIERYHYLLKENPEYILRIPITHLASYLGMSRENLSRLRSKKKL